MQAEDGMKITTIRMPQRLWNRLELVRAATQYHLGERLSLNQLMVSFLEATIRDVEQENPGCFETGKIDMSFMYSTGGVDRTDKQEV